MRNLSVLIPALALGAALLAVPAAAQTLDLPAPSPLARVMQTVGVGEVTVEYSSPGKKGRAIFGDLVPFDEMWRTGANAATKLTVTKPVTIGGKDVPAGTYSVKTVPGKKAWEVIINSDASASGRTYDKAKDVVRVRVKPEKVPATERMTFLFANTTDDSTELKLMWDTTGITVPIEFDTGALAIANIKEFKTQSSRGHASAARYYADTLKDNDMALAHIEVAIATEDNWFNTWIKADILARKGNYREAYPLAQKAMEQGEKAEYFFWKDRVEKALSEWKDKR